MPPLELKELITLIKDDLLGVAAFVTEKNRDRLRYP